MRTTFSMRFVTPTVIVAVALAAVSAGGGEARPDVETGDRGPATRLTR